MFSKCLENEKEKERKKTKHNVNETYIADPD